MSKPSAKVIPFPGTDMPGLGVAATASPGERIGGSRSEIWLRQGYRASGQGLMLFVKPGLSPRQMMVEALSAQVGQCMGLPCPDPYLVTINPLHIGRPRGAGMVAFGSEQVGSRALVRSIRDPEALIEALNAQKLTDLLCCFDELIANGVRHAKDVLLDPESGIAIIDHEGAMEQGTQPDQAVTNWLADRLIATLSRDQRAAFLRKLRARAVAARSIEAAVVPSASQFHQEGARVYGQLLEFLRHRLNHLDELLSKRFLPEQAYLSAEPASDASDRAS